MSLSYRIEQKITNIVHLCYMSPCWGGNNKNTERNQTLSYCAVVPSELFQCCFTQHWKHQMFFQCPASRNLPPAPVLPLALQKVHHKQDFKKADAVFTSATLSLKISSFQVFNTRTSIEWHYSTWWLERKTCSIMHRYKKFLEIKPAVLANPEASFRSKNQWLENRLLFFDCKNCISPGLVHKRVQRLC